MASRRILVIDDEENIGRSLRMILEREGYQVNAVGSASEMRAFPERARIDLFLMDVRLPDASGIDLLRELQANEITAPVVMISGHATIADAVEATRAGAFDFLEKPLGRDRVMVAVKNALEQGTLKQENRRLREAVGAGTKMIGTSPAFTRAVEQAGMAARSDARVLLVGESGTGKELLAAHIHGASPFAAGPFVKVNCAAIPGELIESELFGHEKGSFTGATSMRRGKFELADNGTLFLDEIGDLHANSQAKLLRVLQEGEFHRVGGEQVIRVTVRVVSATNRDLSAMVAQGKFREDLYYRVSVVPIRVPALRERPQDIRPMAEYFLDDFCARNGFRRKSFDSEVWDAFESGKWPGNARELRNAVERMAILSPDDVLSVAAIPLELRMPQRDNGARSSVQEARESAEREHVLRALEEAGWNVSSAARALGMERTNLHKRIRALGLARGK
ncbi:MAG TPA: sigma-54 dependent transcriptional regulator [Bryobacteraceae bacterium]|jgi:two-component system nitrogen regulation response regulator NtrX|nr:sigma-54 dependent transcriptional regulator [Bryobacteraceae bacterium]